MCFPREDTFPYAQCERGLVVPSVAKTTEGTFLENLLFFLWPNAFVFVLAPRPEDELL